MANKTFSTTWKRSCTRQKFTTQKIFLLHDEKYFLYTMQLLTRVKNIFAQDEKYSSYDDEKYFST